MAGLQLGNLWIGVQPALGVEGDPMRLLFEKDLTPHPQYAAFYKWLANDFKASAVVHMGMHGTGTHSNPVILRNHVPSRYHVR